MSGPWLQVTFVVEKEDAPAVEAALDDVGALSVSLTDAADSPLLEPLPGETPLWSLLEITGLFADAPASLMRIHGLVDTIGAHCAGETRIERLVDRVWELDAARLRGSTVVDYGCGSGILAIAALKLGAGHVFAIDHDPQALQATRQNAQANGVDDRISIMAPGREIDPPADITIANILSDEDWRFRA